MVQQVQPLKASKEARSGDDGDGDGNSRAAEISLDGDLYAVKRLRVAYLADDDEETTPAPENPLRKNMTTTTRRDPAREKAELIKKA